MTGRRATSLSLCTILIALAASSSAQTSAPHPHQNASSLQQELIDLQKSFIAARERGDAAYVTNALADDFTSIETNGSTSDKSDVVRDTGPSDSPASPPILYGFKVVQLSDGNAVVTYCAVFPNNQLDKYQHVSDAWVKKTNGWKLKFEQRTLNLWSAHDID
jgi:hypothetical protein